MTGKKKSKPTQKKAGKRQKSDNSAHSRAMPSAKQNSNVEPILQKAGRLYTRKKLIEVIKLLNSLGDKATFENESQKIKYYRLLSFAYANGEEYANAEVAAMKGLQLDENNRDFHFALAFIYSNYQDYDRCLKHAKLFIELFEANENLESQKGWLSYGHQHLIYNFIGLAYKARDDLKSAEKAFIRAIEIHPSYDHPYINLANFYTRRGEHDKATDLVDRGLKKCSQVQELRLLKNMLENRATISACMIVKNEEELLANCLDSIRGWVDEIIIVDTGSTDRTVEIARSYGAKVHFQKWEGDFSKPRNLSLSKAASDWIFVIDADEEFVGDTLPMLRLALNQDKYRIISIDVHNLNQETGIVSSFLPSNRFFRREAKFYYDGIVHNQLIYEKNEPILRADVVLKHYGYDFSRDKMTSKLARSRELLEKQLTERPDDPFVHFNYAQILRSFSLDPDEELCHLIMKHACRAAELSDTDPGGTLHTHLQALHQQITTNIQLNKYTEAIEVARRALELKPDFLDALYSMAEAYARIPDYANGEKYFLQYLEEQEKYSTVDDKLAMIQLFAFSRHRAYYWLGLINQFCKRPEKAVEYFLKTLDEQENFADTNLGLINIYLDRQDLESAKIYIDKELAHNPDSGMAHFYKARYYGLKNDDEKAAEFLDKAVELDDENDEIIQRTGIYWANKGQIKKALPLFEKLATLKPKNPDNLKLLSKAYYDTGNFKDASEWYNKYIELRPNDADAIHDMANCFFKSGDYEKAEKHYARALEINGNLAAVYRNLGLTKIHLGKHKEALALLDVYTGIAPGDLEIEFAMASVLAQTGDFTSAIPHYEKFLAGNPVDINGLFGISECYFNLGHTASAAIGYKQILKLNSNFQPARKRLDEIETFEFAARTS